MLSWRVKDGLRDNSVIDLMSGTADPPVYRELYSTLSGSCSLLYVDIPHALLTHALIMLLYCEYWES